MKIRDQNGHKEQGSSRKFFCIQFNLDALLRNSIALDKSVTDKKHRTKVDFVEPQGKKRESTPLPRIDKSI